MDLPPYTLRQLNCLVTAVTCGSISAAAVELRVSPGAVSMAIAELERLLGAQLVLRKPARGVTPTAAGAAMLADARGLIEAANELRQHTQELGSALTGRLVVGCYRPLAPFYLPVVLEHFAAAHPGLDVRFVEGSLVEVQGLLHDGGCEVALLYEMDLQPDIAIDPLVQTLPNVVLPADHPRARDAVVDLQELADEPVVLLDVPPSLHHTMGVFEQVGVQPRIAHVSANAEVVRALVGRGLGWSVLIQHPFGDVTYDGRQVVMRAIAGDPGRVDVVLAWPSAGRPTRRTQEFMRFCHSRFAGPTG